jgi:hypothetical protein
MNHFRNGLKRETNFKIFYGSSGLMSGPLVPAEEIVMRAQLRTGAIETGLVPRQLCCDLELPSGG